MLALSTDQWGEREELGREKEKEEGLPDRLTVDRPCNALKSDERDNHLSLIASNCAIIAIQPFTLSFSLFLHLSVSLALFPSLLLFPVIDSGDTVLVHLVNI